MDGKSESGWVEKELREKLANAESHLAYHEGEVERFRLRIAALQQELGTLPVGEKIR